MAKKKADEVKKDDVVVDRLSFLRVVLEVVTFTFKLGGKIVGIVYRDHGSEFYDKDHELTVLDDEGGDRRKRRDGNGLIGG